MATKKKRDCKCVAEVNKALAKQGDELDVFFLLTTGVTRPKVATRRIDGDRRRSIVLAATYCPFCGQEYPYPS